MKLSVLPDTNRDCMFWLKLTIVMSVPDISNYIYTKWNTFKYGSHIATFFKSKHNVDIHVQIL